MYVCIFLSVSGLHETIQQYLYYDQNGDLHECVNKRLFAFRGPVDVTFHGESRSYPRLISFVSLFPLLFECLSTPPLYAYACMHPRMRAHAKRQRLVPLGTLTSVIMLVCVRTCMFEWVRERTRDNMVLQCTLRDNLRVHGPVTMQGNSSQGDYFQALRRLLDIAPCCTQAHVHNRTLTCVHTHAAPCT